MCVCVCVCVYIFIRVCQTNVQRSSRRHEDNSSTYYLLTSAIGGGEWLGAHPEEECSEYSVQKTHRTQNRFRCDVGGCPLLVWNRNSIVRRGASNLTDLYYIFNLLSFLKTGEGGICLLCVCVCPPPDFVPFEPLDVHRARYESYATGGHPSAVNVNFLPYVKTSMQTQLLRRHELKRQLVGWDDMMCGKWHCRNVHCFYVEVTCL
jgi:hypothetical protein